MATTLLYFLIPTAMLLVILIAIWSSKPTMERISMRMRHIVPVFQYSTLQFYTELTKRIGAYQMKELRFERTSYGDSSFMIKWQEYLRIRRNRLIFDICAAPHGTTFFISWWIGETTDSAAYVLARIPFIGKLLERRYEHKSIYEFDLDAVFEETVQRCINELIADITTTAGVRTPEQGILITQPVEKVQ